MRDSSDHDSEIPGWLRSLGCWAWANRNSIGPAVGMVLLVIALPLALAYFFAPSDLDRAEADWVRAADVVKKLRADALDCGEEATTAATHVAEMRAEIRQGQHSADAAWLRYQVALCDTLEQRHADYSRRRDALLALVADYLPLIAEAKREVLRGRTARDRGHPVRIATRVREILAPVLAPR